MGKRLSHSGIIMTGAILTLLFVPILFGCVAREAEIKPEDSIPTDPLTKIVNLNQDKPSFNIDVWTDKKRYRIGEAICFYFRSDQDCYLTLVDYETNGNVKVLFPNRYYQNNSIRAGKTYIIPGSEYGFKLTVEPPPGIERIKAIATTEPLSLFNLNFTRNFFPPVERSNTRGMRSISTALDSLPNFNWAENSCTISIR